MIIFTKRLKIWKKRILGDDDVGETKNSQRDDLLKTNNEIETLISKDRYDNVPFEDY